MSPVSLDDLVSSVGNDRPAFLRSPSFPGGNPLAVGPINPLRQRRELVDPPLGHEVYEVSH